MQQISSDLSKINSWYKSVERKFKIRKPINGEYRPLCNAKENINLPVYSWYNLKEAFSYSLPQWVLKKLAQDYNFNPKNALDPFAGGGTSLLSLATNGIQSTGVEYNPFIAWTSYVKSRWKHYNPSEIFDASLKIEFSKYYNIKVPELSTLHNGKYFNLTDVKVLMSVLHQIEYLSYSTDTKNFLKIGVSSAIEKFSHLRKDGRALRFKENRDILSAKEAIKSVWYRNLNQLRHAQKTWNPNIPDPKVYNGSALNLNEARLVYHDSKFKADANNTYDLVLYSPPYLNNFDYSEIYKLELWALGFLQDHSKWQDLRKGTLRSHHSVKFDRPSYLTIHNGSANLVEFINFICSSPLLENNAKKLMPDVIAGYFADMYKAIEEQYKVLNKGGFLVYNVANSQHSKLPIATDLLIAEVAQIVGFTPLELYVLHNRNGRARGNSFLRESLVFLRKD